MRPCLLAFAMAVITSCSGRALAEHPAELVPTPEPHVGSMPLPARRVPHEAPADEIAYWRYHLEQRTARSLHLKQLDAAVQLATAELQSLDRQIQNYEWISRPRHSDPFLVTLESAKLRRLAVELQLEQLHLEKRLTLQNFQAARRLRQLEIATGLR